MNIHKGHRITFTQDMLSSLNLPEVGASKEQEDATIKISRAMISCLIAAGNIGKMAAARQQSDGLWVNIKNDNDGTERIQLSPDDFMNFLDSIDRLADKQAEVFHHAYDHAKTIARDLFAPDPSFVHVFMTNDHHVCGVETNLTLSEKERTMIEETAKNIEKSREARDPQQDNALARSMQIALERLGCTVSLYKTVGDIELSETALKKMGIFCTGLSPQVAQVKEIVLGKMDEMDERIAVGEPCTVTANDAADAIVFDEDMPGITTDSDHNHTAGQFEAREDGLFRQSIIDALADYGRTAEDTEDADMPAVKADAREKMKTLLDEIYEVKAYLKLSFCTQTGDLLDEQGNLNDFREEQQTFCAKKALALVAACLPPEKKEALVAIRGWDMDNRALTEIMPDFQPDKEVKSPAPSPMR